MSLWCCSAQVISFISLVSLSAPAESLLSVIGTSMKRLSPSYVTLYPMSLSITLSVTPSSLHLLSLSFTISLIVAFLILLFSFLAFLLFTSYFQFFSVNLIPSVSLFSHSHLFSISLFSCSSFQRLCNPQVIHQQFIDTPLHPFPSLPLPSSLSSFLHLLCLCHLCSIHYQFTQSADHIIQRADTYHTYQIDPLQPSLCVCVCLMSRKEL